MQRSPVEFTFRLEGSINNTETPHHRAICKKYNKAETLICVLQEFLTKNGDVSKNLVMLLTRPHIHEKLNIKEKFIW